MGLGRGRDDKVVKQRALYIGSEGHTTSSVFQFCNNSSASEPDTRKFFTNEELGTGSKDGQRRSRLRINFCRLSYERVEIHDGGAQVGFGSVLRWRERATTYEMGLPTKTIFCGLVLNFEQ